MIAASALERVEIAVRDGLTAIGDWFSAITTPGWALIAIAAFALLWLWSAIRAQTRLGPLEVVALEHDAEADKPPLLALTSEFRERLWRAGLTPPPLVPEGAPQADLIKAVEGTGTQGATLARFLEMLPSPPRPPQFKLMSTLIGLEARPAAPTDALDAADEDSDAADGTLAREHGPAGPCGVIFTLQSIGGGAPYVNSVTGCATHSAALGRAAADIYQRITVTSSEVFPLWVRWRSPEALQAYLDGCDKRRQEGQLEVAIARLKDAVDRSPFNALAALQLANLYEQLAAASGTNRWETAYFRAMALVEYMRIAMLWPRLVEARYRASVAAAGLATAYDHLDREAGAAEGDAIEAMVPLPATPGDFPSRLRKLAARESSATVQLLHPVYTLIRERRMRNQFESKSRDRRALRRTVKISRHCVRMRRLNAMPDGLLWRSEARLRSLDVHLWHLRAGSASITWQARYNAACFDGLQLCPVRDDDADDGRASRMGARRRDRVERRALRNLDRAIREASGELKYDWVRYDPDMEYFRA